MTKFEAWEAWLLENNFHTGQAKEALEHSSHGQTFSYAWDTAMKLERDNCASIVEKAGEDGYGTLAAAMFIRTQK